MNIRNGKKRSEQILIIVINAAYSILWFLTESARVISWMAAMSNVSATETAIIYGLEPIWGAGFAWFLLGERWGLSGWIGAAFVLGGSLSVQILGASSSSLSGQVEKVIQDDKLSISHKRNNIHASPLVISCKEDPTDLLRKS
uniref:EamA domain-containing protein n=1 Tax=Solanum lycopersicum TaxID=4081 RepID=A0A3Q7GEN7_SOLLC